MTSNKATEIGDVLHSMIDTVESHLMICDNSTDIGLNILASTILAVGVGILGELRHLRKELHPSENRTPGPEERSVRRYNADFSERCV